MLALAIVLLLASCAVVAYALSRPWVGPSVRWGTILLALVVALAVLVGASVSYGASTAQAAPANTGMPAHDLRHVERVVYVQTSAKAQDRYGYHVTQAVKDWQRGTDVDVRRGDCRRGAGCINVSVYNQRSDGRAGYVLFYEGANRRFTGTVQVKINNAHRGSHVRGTVCHEVGHGLGLMQHNPSRDSCMYRDTSSADVPTSADRTRLNRVY